MCQWMESSGVAMDTSVNILEMEQTNTLPVDTSNDSALWSEITHQLQASYGDAIYRSWLMPLSFKMVYISRHELN